MNMGVKKIFGVGVLWVSLFLVNGNVLAASDFIFVQSAPLTTTLAIPDVPTTQATWLAMINGAKHKINFGSFYFTDQSGEALRPVVVALQAAARRGVKIRILLDASLKSDSDSSIAELQGEPNIKFAILPMGFITGGIMHAKYLVVDGRDVYVGSANFDWRSLAHVHEMGARVHSRALAAEFTEVFNYDWQMATNGFVAWQNRLAWYLNKHFVWHPITADYLGEKIKLQAYVSPPALLPAGATWELPALVALLDGAKKEISLQVLTFAPGPIYGHKKAWYELYEALKRAAARGVKVRLILSDWVLAKKASLPYLTALAALPNVAIKISHIPKYKNREIPFARVEHLKYVVVDNDRVWLGTGNWEWSYFYTTRDLSLIITGAKPNQVLRELFSKDWNSKYCGSFKMVKSVI